MTKLITTEKLSLNQVTINELLKSASSAAHHIGILDLVVPTKNEKDKELRVSSVILCYDPDPPKKEYSKFFGYIVKDLDFYVTGLPIFSGIIPALYDPLNDEVLMSTSRHDFVESEHTLGLFIDGGMEYTRYGKGINDAGYLVDFDLATFTFQDKDGNIKSCRHQLKQRSLSSPDQKAEENLPPPNA